MIIVRSPLRVSLGGGGTDLASYYSEFGGFLIAGAIDKYVFVSAMRPFTKGIFLKYAELEKVETVDEIKHPIIREVLKLQEVKTSQIEITTLADIASGTGLGSSGSFTTALIKALYVYKRNFILPQNLAELACHIEIDKLGEPIGKQDQYIAAFGGLTCFTFNKNGTVDAQPLNISTENFYELEDRLMLFFTGFSRSASSILKDQNVKSKEHNQEMIDNLHFVKELGYKSKDALEKGDIFGFGKLLHTHWEHKRIRSKGMSNDQINIWYQAGIDNGAIGGKLVGAGGGGFLMFLAEDKTRLRKAMSEQKLQEVRFHFDFEGTKVILE
jgi:D-glycero-alpha-D-manno-heptose-7-phosphate kinase